MTIRDKDGRLHTVRLVPLPGARLCSEPECGKVISGNKLFCLAHPREGVPNEPVRSVIHGQ